MENQVSSKPHYLTYVVDTRFPVIVLAIVFGLLTPLLALIEGLSLLDSLYYTVVVLTSVGYGDITPMTAMGKIIVLFMMLGGLIAVLSIIFTVFYYVRLGQHYEREISAQ